MAATRQNKATVDRRTINPEALEKLRQTIIRLFSGNAFNDIGIRDICREAKVSPQTVYKYYGNKESLLFACIHQDIEQLYERVRQAVMENCSLEKRLIKTTKAFFSFYESNPTIARIIFMNIPPVNWVHGRDFSQAPMMDALSRLLREAQNQKLLPDLPVTLMLDVMAGAAHRVILRWLNEPEGPSLNTMADNFIQLIQSGFILPHSVNRLES